VVAGEICWPTPGLVWYQSQGDVPAVIWGAAVADWVRGISTFVVGAICLTLVAGSDVRAEEREHALVLELGPAGEWPFSDRPNFGGTFAIEATPIEKLA
jgi:hypothetical protein